MYNFRSELRHGCGHQFSPRLKARIEQFFYELLAKAFLRAEEKTAGEPATVTAVQNALTNMQQEALEIFHTCCDAELLCPHCGEVHMHVELFDKLINAEFRRCMNNFDQSRLHNVMASIRYTV